MIEQNTQQQKQFKILVIGDNCVDVYRYGSVDRISPEAPVPIFKYSHEESKPGMGANVVNNLEALGCSVSFFTSTDVSKKIRLIDKRSNQHILRIDEDVAVEPLDISLFKNIESYDAIVISDYNKGTVSYDLVSYLRKNFKGPMFMDTKKQDLSQFYGIFVKINELEFKNRWSINDSLIVTLGSKGAMYKTGRDPRHETFFPVGEVEVVDVTGAGDTFLSSLVFKFLETDSIEDSIKFANKASAVTVQKFGVYAPTLEELQ